jgi:hypothetical protein
VLRAVVLVQDWLQHDHRRGGEGPHHSRHGGWMKPSGGFPLLFARKLICFHDLLSARCLSSDICSIGMLIPIPSNPEPCARSIPMTYVLHKKVSYCAGLHVPYLVIVILWS